MKGKAQMNKSLFLLSLLFIIGCAAHEPGANRVSYTPRTCYAGDRLDLAEPLYVAQLQYGGSESLALGLRRPYGIMVLTEADPRMQLRPEEPVYGRVYWLWVDDTPGPAYRADWRRQYYPGSREFRLVPNDDTYYPYVDFNYTCIVHEFTENWVRLELRDKEAMPKDDASKMKTYY